MCIRDSSWGEAANSGRALSARTRQVNFRRRLERLAFDHVNDCAWLRTTPPPCLRADCRPVRVSPNNAAIRTETRRRGGAKPGTVVDMVERQSFEPPAEVDLSGSGRKCPAAVGGFTPRAVSYTHLRAHETVLD